MDINEIILTDEALNVIDNGTWIDDIEGAPGLELLVVGLTSKDARKSIEQKQAAARLKNRGKALTAEQLAEAMRQTLSEVVIKGWKGLTEGGKPVEFTPELAKSWINSRKGEKFAGMVLQAAQRVDDQANDFVKEVSKN